MTKLPKIGARYRNLIDHKIIKITRIESDIFYSVDEGKTKELPAPIRFLDYFEEIPEEPLVESKPLDDTNVGQSESIWKDKIKKNLENMSDQFSNGYTRPNVVPVRCFRELLDILTDFINQQDQLQKDIQELKKER